MCPTAAMIELKVVAALTAWRSRWRWAWFLQAVTTVAVSRSLAGTVVYDASAVRSGSGADTGPVAADGGVGDRDGELFCHLLPVDHLAGPEADPVGTRSGRWR